TCGGEKSQTPKGQITENAQRPKSKRRLRLALAPPIALMPTPHDRAVHHVDEVHVVHPAALRRYGAGVQRPLDARPRSPRPETRAPSRPEVTRPFGARRVCERVSKRGRTTLGVD